MSTLVHACTTMCATFKMTGSGLKPEPTLWLQSRSGALAVGSVQAALRQAGFNLDDTVVHVRGSMGLLMGHTGRMSGKGVHEANYACAGSAKHTTVCAPVRLLGIEGMLCVELRCCVAR